MLKAVPKALIAKTRYGLANRLLTVVSVARLADIFHRSIATCWPLNADCPVDFREIINCPGIRVVSFLDGIPNKTGEHIKPQEIAKFRTVSLQFDSEIYLPDDDKEHTDFSSYFTKLRPHKAVGQKVADFLRDNNNLNNVIGVHIRKGDKRTSGPDAKNLIEKYDRQYIKVLKNLMNIMPDARFFISSDEPTEKIQELLKDRYLSYPKRHNPLIRKKDNLEEAIIDMILLSKTNYVLYGLGTFGYCGAIMSNVDRINILSGDRRLTLFARQSIQASPYQVIYNMIGVPMPKKSRVLY